MSPPQITRPAPEYPKTRFHPLIVLKSPEFLIFDHWGNFEYFDERVKEEEPSQPKSLPQLLFEARIALAETALEKQNLDAFKIAVALLEANVRALPNDCLSVREKWKLVKSIQRDGVIEAFEPHTVATLKREIAPLMMWIDTRSKEDALQFDLLIARLQEARLNGAAQADDYADTVAEQAAQLPIRLKPVAEKLDAINRAKDPGFHAKASTGDLDTLRSELRGIMKYCEKGGGGAVEPLFLDVAEEAAGYKTGEHKVKMQGMDLLAYRNRVESVLRELFEASDVLQKIKSGQPVAEDEIKSLVTDVLVRDPDLNLDDLLKHYPNKSESLALAIRQVIGMNAKAVDEHFKTFVRKYPSLNANQIRFLEMLKGHLARYGVVELDQLWDSPFTSIHTAGIDGVFTEEQQIDDLLELLNQLNQPAA